MTTLIILAFALGTIQSNLPDAQAMASLHLESDYTISPVTERDNETRLHAEIESYLVNDSRQTIRVFAFANNVSALYANKYYVFSAGLGRRRDGRIVRSKAGTFEPVTLRPGESARLPNVVVLLPEGKADIEKFTIYYKVDCDLGEAEGVWCGELSVVPNRRI